MKYVIIDSRLPASVKRSLSELGFNTIEMPVWERLQKPVSAHPDMLLFIADGKIICHRSYFELAGDLLGQIARTAEAELILSEEPMSAKYPSDVLFNAARLGRRLICKKASTSRHILSELPQILTVRLRK